MERKGDKMMELFVFYSIISICALAPIALVLHIVNGILDLTGKIRNKRLAPNSHCAKEKAQEEKKEVCKKENH